MKCKGCKYLHDEFENIISHYCSLHDEHCTVDYSPIETSTDCCWSPKDDSNFSDLLKRIEKLESRVEYLEKARLADIDEKIRRYKSDEEIARLRIQYMSPRCIGY